MYCIPYRTRGRGSQASQPRSAWPLDGWRERGGFGQSTTRWRRGRLPCAAPVKALQPTWCVSPAYPLRTFQLARTSESESVSGIRIRSAGSFPPVWVTRRERSSARVSRARHSESSRLRRARPRTWPGNGAHAIRARPARRRVPVQRCPSSRAASMPRPSWKCRSRSATPIRVATRTVPRRNSSSRAAVVKSPTTPSDREMSRLGRGMPRRWVWTTRKRIPEIYCMDVHAPPRADHLWEAAAAAPAGNDPHWDEAAQPPPETEFDQRLTC